MTKWAMRVGSLNELSIINSGDIKLPKAIKTGDKAIVYETRGEDVEFLGLVHIDSVKLETRSTNTGAEEFVARVDFVYDHKFENPVNLVMLTYSLKKITNFSSPQNNFQRVITKLD